MINFEHPVTSLHGIDKGRFEFMDWNLLIRELTRKVFATPYSPYLSYGPLSFPSLSFIAMNARPLRASLEAGWVSHQPIS